MDYRHRKAQFGAPSEAGSGVSSLDLSPDGKYIEVVYRKGNGLPRLGLIDVESKQLVPVTDGSYPDSKAVFDRTGNTLYLVSSRTVSPSFDAYELNTYASNTQSIYVLTLAKATPDPMAAAPEGTTATKENNTTIDLDGVAGRMRRLPIPSGSFGAVIGIKNGLLFQQGDTLMKYSIGSKSTTPVLSGGAASLAISLIPKS